MLTKKLIIIACLLCIGCKIWPRLMPEPVPKEVYIEKVKTEIMYKNLGTVQGMLIIGATGGLIVCFLKMPAIGIPIFLGCTGGLGLIAARVYYGALMGIVALIAAVLAIVYAIYINRRAFTQIIAGDKQTKATEKMVAKTRKKLNGKNNNV